MTSMNPDPRDPAVDLAVAGGVIADSSPPRITALITVMLRRLVTVLPLCEHRRHWPDAIATNPDPAELLTLLAELRTDLRAGCHCWHGPVEQLAAHALCGLDQVIDRARQHASAAGRGGAGEGYDARLRWSVAEAAQRIRTLPEQLVRWS